MTVPLDSDSLASLSPDKLARLLDLDPGQQADGPHTATASGWTRSDAVAALRQQLHAPLLPDLLACPGASRQHLGTLLDGMPDALTFATLLTSSSPSIELLQALKHWARFLRDQSSSPLHGTPATVLYYAAIAAALVRTGQRITTLTDAQLRPGFEWSVLQEGAEPLDALFREARSRLG